VTFSNPVQVEFGIGCIATLDNALRGRTAALLTTPGAAARGLVDRIREIAGTSVAVVYADIPPNPTLESVLRVHEALTATPFEAIVAAGGGSVIDTAKAVAALRGTALPSCWLARHLRSANPIPASWSPIPIVAVPTTAGTGSEVTMWATIWDDANRSKLSLSHPSLYPESALVDPALTLGATEELTLVTALDALSHAMEAIWNRHHNPVSDALAIRAIAIIIASLPSALADGDDLASRSALHGASLVSGLAFSNTRTALAHSISYPLTAERGLPHGLACSFTLPEVLLLNAEADRARVMLVAEAMGCTSVEAAHAQLYQLFGAFKMGERLRAFVTRGDDIDELTGTMLTPGRADNNLAAVTESGARALAKRALARLAEN
jgi:phosphonate metabolism-associated iron-containing alcohol dehydrogenase